MNSAAGLSRPAIEALSNHNASIHELARDFAYMENAHGNKEESPFERSLRIKNTLDLLEERSKNEPSENILAIFLACEYLLWYLQADVPLRHNPFLSHWVEVIQRLEPNGPNEALVSTNSAVSISMIDAARVRWVKTLLLNSDVQHYIQHTPMGLCYTLLCDGPIAAFDLQPYITTLEEEGIYEKTPEPEGTGTSSRSLEKSENGIIEQDNEDKAVSATDTLEQWKEGVLRDLQENQENAIFQLSHPPILISYLDFITTILTDRTLEKHSIEPAPVINSCTQSMLRSIERMGRPPTPGNESADEAQTRRVTFDHVQEYGKEAQTRAVQLLLLFMKSLLRKGLVGTDVLYFEIQEICVRYVWIKEAREFRTWVETGTETNPLGFK